MRRNCSFVNNLFAGHTFQVIPNRETKPSPLSGFPPVLLTRYADLMPIQDRHIEQLRRIYRRRYGREFSVKEAWVMAHRLVTLYRILTKAGNNSVVDSPASDRDSESETNDQRPSPHS
jgi:hypothetical protein